MAFLVRNWRPADTFEPSLASELAGIRLTSALTWVAIGKDAEGGESGHVYGYLMGAAGHGIGWLLRLKVVEGHSDLTALALVHAAIGDCQKAGLSGFTVLLGDTESESRLRGMMARAGATETPCSGVWATLKLSQPMRSSIPMATSEAAPVPTSAVASSSPPAFIREVR